MMEEKKCFGCFAAETNGQKCSNCGFSLEMYELPAYALRPGSLLQNRYVIGKVLGTGGFGITYLAYDKTLDVKMAIKEYLPKTLALREQNTISVKPNSTLSSKQFTHHKSKFMEEAKALAKFNNEPGIVSIQDVFEANDTVYIVMYYIEGVTLEAYVKEKGGKLYYKEALDTMSNVVHSLAAIHDQNLIHRDISPDNIFITNNNQVKLLDFGAARYVSEDKNQTLSVILKHGYAPVEQYSSSSKQGPWTDVYAISATLYWLMTGIKPQESMERMLSDELKKLTEIDDTIPAHINDAIIKGLAIKSQNRFQNLHQFWQAISNDDDSAVTMISAASHTVTNDTSVGKLTNKKFTYIISGILAVIIGAVIINGFNNSDIDGDANFAADEQQISVAAKLTEEPQEESVSIAKSTSTDKTVTTTIKETEEIIEVQKYILEPALNEYHELGFENLFDTYISMYNDGLQTDGELEFALGYMHYFGLGIEQNKELGVQYFTESAESNNLKGELWLTRAMFFGAGIEKDESEAYSNLTKHFDELINMANEGDEFMQEFLGTVYSEGLSITVDKEKAAHWYNKSYNNKNAIASFNLARMYMYGTGVEQNRSKAYDILKAIDDYNMVYVYYNLGIIKYYEAEGVQQDSIEALKWFELAAELDHSDANNKCGYIYNNDEAVEKDTEKVVRYYTRAAELGSNSGTHNSGLLYLNGNGVEKDIEKAIEYFTVAAQNGYRNSQLKLGSIYISGKYMDPDQEESQKWYGMVKEDTNTSIRLEKLEPFYVSEDRPEKIESRMDFGKWNTSETDNLGNSYSGGFGIYHEGGFGYGGASAYMERVYLLNNEYVLFDGILAVNNSSKNNVSDKQWAKILVFGDEKLLFESQIIKGGVKPIPFTVNLSGIEEMKLIIRVDDVNFGIVDSYLYK